MPLPAPGGNGSEYRHIRGGVYIWLIKAKVPFSTHSGGKTQHWIGWFYAGSSHDLAQRKNFWTSSQYSPDVVRLIRKNRNFTWRVVTRDWDTGKHGKMPYGLSRLKVRLGAEQLAIVALKQWGKAHHWYAWNKVNAIGNQDWKAEALKAARQLLRNQQENNAIAGPDVMNGDHINEGARNIPAGAWGEIDSGGRKGHG